MSWWSKEYSRPLKDPLLLSYTLEELLYEFYDKIERGRIEIEYMTDDTSDIDAAAVDEDIQWAEKEAEKDRERMKEEELKRQKAEHGEGFGEDIVADLSDDKVLVEEEDEI